MSATGFDKQDEEDQVLDEVELGISVNINHNLTESDIITIDMRSKVELQIQNREMKDSGWRFYKITRLTIYFH